MLQPKKTKFRRHHRLRGQMRGIASRGNTLAYGEIGIKAVGRGEITSRQIEAARRAIARAMKRGGKVWIRVFPDRNVSAKGAEVPMGSGKGAPDHFVQQVKPGRMLFEVAGVEEKMMRHALELAIYKLPMKCKIISKTI